MPVKLLKLVFTTIALALAAGPAASQRAAEPPKHGAPPPPALRVDRFYAQYQDAGGVPVLGSKAVPPAAIRRAARLVLEMTRNHPEWRAMLAGRGYRVAIMAPSEGTTDLPEQREWKRPAIDDPRLTVCERKHYDERIGRLTDAQYWNWRARGMAGPLTSGAAEDLLGQRQSRYFGETIFVHEFSHDILEAIRASDAALYRAVEAAYAAALASGRWKGEYASTNIDEYWAEGSQFWFESNRLAVFDGVRILNAGDLERYDPPLAAVLRRAYGDRHHLAGDPFWRHKARVPPGPPPQNTAEVC